MPALKCKVCGEIRTKTPPPGGICSQCYKTNYTPYWVAQRHYAYMRHFTRIFTKQEFIEWAIPRFEPIIATGKQPRIRIVDRFDEETTPITLENLFVDFNHHTGEYRRSRRGTRQPPRPGNCRTCKVCGYRWKRGRLPGGICSMCYRDNYTAHWVAARAFHRMRWHLHPRRKEIQFTEEEFCKWAEPKLEPILASGRKAFFWLPDAPVPVTLDNITMTVRRGDDLLHCVKCRQPKAPEEFADSGRCRDCVNAYIRRYRLTPSGCIREAWGAICDHARCTETRLELTAKEFRDYFLPIVTQHMADGKRVRIQRIDRTLPHSLDNLMVKVAGEDAGECEAVDVDLTKGNDGNDHKDRYNQVVSAQDTDQSQEGPTLLSC